MKIVCAYVDHESIQDDDDIPSILGSWLGRTVENIEMIRNGLYDNTIPGVTCYIQDSVSAVAYFGQLNKYIRESNKSNDSERILNMLRPYERRSRLLKSNFMLPEKINHKKTF